MTREPATHQGDHERHQGDPAAYLLGALPDPEREAFESHLEECAACREELDYLRPAAEALPLSVPPERPPETLKQSLMAVVREEAGERDEAPARRSLRSRLPSLTKRGPVLAWVSAAFLLAVGIAFGAVGTSVLSDDGGRELSAQVDPVRLPEATGNLAVASDPSRGAILRVHGMPSLPSREVYQVWIQRKGEMVSQSIFSVGEDGNGAAAVPGNLEGAEAVLVTREPAGGARAPSGKPVVSVQL